MRYLTNFNKKNAIKFSLMDNQLTAEGDGLRLFFTDDIYMVNDAPGYPIEVIENSASSMENAAVSAEVKSMTDERLGSIESPATAPLEFKYLGKNQRNILILVNDAEHEVSDESGRELLRKIVKSINLSANDFALLNYHHYPAATYSQLMQHFSSTIIFSFGVPPEKLQMSAQPMNVVVKKDDVMLVFSTELKQLNADQNSKKILWGSLKQLGL